MTGIGFGVGLAIRNGGFLAQVISPSAPKIRIAPVNANEAYVVAPHASLGAVAWRFLKGNGGDLAIPAGSIGAPFGGWRLAGVARLAEVDAALSQRTVLHEGIGALQYALLLGEGVSQWGGVYHGGLANFTETLPDMTQAAMIATFTASHAATITWPGGQSAAVSESVTIGPDGGLATVTTITCNHDLLRGYLDMTLAGTGFIRVQADGGAWQDVAAIGEHDLTGFPVTVVLRDPATGYTISVTDDAAQQSHFARKQIVRRADGTKLYPEFNPPYPDGWGTLGVRRTQTIGLTAPDPTVTLAGPVAQDEGNSGTTAYVFTVTRSASAGAVAVSWSFAAGATQANDFAGGNYPPGGAVAFTDGQASATLTIAVQGDAIAEAEESFTVGITAPLGYAPGATMTATGTILNDDAAAAWSWSGATNGTSSIYIVQNGTTYTAGQWGGQVSFSGNQLVLTRGAGTGASGFARVTFAMTGLTPGQSYMLPASMTVTGGSPSAGTVVNVSANQNGSSGVAMTPSNAAANGGPAYGFTATAATMHLVLQQAWASGSDNILRMTSLGPVA